MMRDLAQSQREAAEQVVNSFFHMCNSHCPVNLASLITPNIQLLYDGTADGKDAVYALLVSVWERFPDLTFRVENLIVDGDNIAAEVTYTGGPADRGRRCLLFHLHSGLIRRVRVY